MMNEISGDTSVLNKRSFNALTYNQDNNTELVCLHTRKISECSFCSDERTYGDSQNIRCKHNTIDNNINDRNSINISRIVSRDDVNRSNMSSQNLSLNSSDEWFLPKVKSKINPTRENKTVKNIKQKTKESTNNNKKEKSFTAIICNLNEMAEAYDLIIKETKTRKAGILLTSEPNHKKSMIDGSFHNRKKTSTAIVNKNLIGKTTEWTAHNDFVTFKWEDINFVSCYFSPNDTLQELEKILDELDIYIKSIEGRLIICGDLNCRSEAWGDRITTARGKLLEDFVNSNNLTIKNDCTKFIPTYIGHRGQSVVDVVLCSQEIENKLEIEILEDNFLTDHRCVVVKYNKPTTDVQNVNNNIKYGWYVKKEKMPDFNRLTKEKVQEIINSKGKLQPTDCDEIISEVCDILFVKKEEEITKNSVYWWNKEISMLRKKSFKIRRKIINLRSKKKIGAKLDNLIIEWNRIKKELLEKIKESKSKCWKKLIKELDEDPWGKGYQIIRRRIKNPKIASESSLSEEEINEQVKELFPDYGKTTWEKNHYEREEIPPITGEELSEALIRMRIGKAPGPNLIIPLLVKQFINANWKYFLDMMNEMIKNADFPEIWKVARLVLIPKENPNPNTKKYRPICMLNSISKIYEQIIAARILEQIELSPDQFGFGKGKSTVQALKKLKRIYDLNTQLPDHHRKIMCVIGLDIKNAFNSLNWKDIIKALEYKKVPSYIIELMKNYLSNRIIKYNGISFEINSGVGQGSVLSALLWNITFDYIVRLKTKPGTD